MRQATKLTGNIPKVKVARKDIIKSTRPYPFARGRDPVPCDLCGLQYADMVSYQDHIICCMHDHPEAAAKMHGGFEQTFIVRGEIEI